MKYDPDQLRRDNPLVEYAEKRGIQLKRQGTEWVGLSPFTQERTPSFTIFLDKRGAQRFQCFSSGKGGDVIDFSMELDGYTFPEACEHLAGDRPARRKNIAAPTPPHEAFDPYSRFAYEDQPEETAFRPGERTPPIWNPKRVADGEVPQVHYTPKAVYPYRHPNGVLAGYVLRIEFPHPEPGRKPRKITPMVCWVRDRETGELGWSHFPLPEPRPAYGVEDLEEARHLLVVEGEKVRDTVRPLLQRNMVCLAYAGGKEAFARTDWGFAQGRVVALSPDAGEGGEASFLGSWNRRGDQWRPGLADHLFEIGVARLILIRPDPERPDGWDLADLVEEGATKADLIRYIQTQKVEWTREAHQERKERLRPLAEPLVAMIQTDQPAPAPGGSSGHVVEFPAKKAGKKKDESDGVVRPPPEPVPVHGPLGPWKNHCVCKPDGEPEPRVNHNFYVAFRAHPSLCDVFAYDEFAERIVLRRAPPWESSNTFRERMIANQDYFRAVGALEQIGFRPKENQVRSAIHAAAYDKRFNPVREWMERQVWDGKPRLETWLHHYGGALDTRLNRAIGKKFVISIVARVMEPGCKVDSMLVIQGKQGLQKSSLIKALATLDGIAYHVDNPGDLSSDATTLKLQGCLIAEVPEMSPVKTGDVDKVKQWITSTSERIRKPYAHDPEPVQRKFVLAGTLNPENGYLQDETGSRRFMTVDVVKCEAEQLQEAVPQIYAEAVQAYHAGELWYLDKEEEAMLTEFNRQHMTEHPWVWKIGPWVQGKTEVTMDQVLFDCIGMPTKEQKNIHAKQAGALLRRLGFEPKFRSRNSTTVRVWVRSNSEEDQGNE